MLPALLNGWFLGTYQAMAHWGLTSVSNAAPNAGAPSYDQIRQFIPWSTLASAQVHAGHLPLWNPYNLLGMPLAFNWQSSAFSLPSLVGYVFPSSWSYTVQVLLTLYIGGAGVYVLCRVLRISVLGASLSATAFALSGPFMGFLGWPISSVMSWSGWLLAGVTMVIAGRYRLQSMVGLAVVIAFAVYGGFPETLVILGLAAACFSTVMLVAAGIRGESVGGRIVDLVVSAIAGAALGAPLWLPAAQLSGRAARASATGFSALPVHDLLNLGIDGYEGGPASNYFGFLTWRETAAYVGVVVLVLALAAIVVYWRRPQVAALVALAILATALAFLPPVVSALDSLPYGGAIRWYRALMIMALAISVLAGFGIDALRTPYRSRVWIVIGVGFCVSVAAVGVLYGLHRKGISNSEATERAGSLFLPLLASIGGVLVVGIGVLWRRLAGRQGGALTATVTRSALLVIETVVVVLAQVPIWSSSASGVVRTPAARRLAREVGDQVVGFGTASCHGPHQLGIAVDTNILFSVDEFAVYDPMVSHAYVRAWRSAGGTVRSLSAIFPVFCPAVSTSSLAREFGIGYVLESPHQAAPAGSVFVERLAHQLLYRIPGAATATFTPSRGAGPTTAVRVVQSIPGTLSLTTKSDSAGSLRLRVSDVPGWQASIDGHPLPLRAYKTVMLQANVPAGTHSITLRYWPKAFSIGLILAAASAVSLVVVLIIGFRRRHPPG